METSSSSSNTSTSTSTAPAQQPSQHEQVQVQVQGRPQLAPAQQAPQHEQLQVQAQVQGRPQLVLDAAPLDEYLHSLLPFGHLVRYFPKEVREYYASAVPAILVPLARMISLHVSQGKTPACQALGLEMILLPSMKQEQASSLSLSLSSRRRLVRWMIYALLAFGLPHLYKRAKSKWRLYQQQQQQEQSRLGVGVGVGVAEEDFNVNVTPRQQLASDRRGHLVDRFVQLIDTTLPLVRLALLLRCWTGHATAPSVALWLTGLSYTKANSPATIAAAAAAGSTTTTTTTTIASDDDDDASSLHTLYAHRRWVHTEGMRLMPLVVTPLLHSARESRQWLSTYWSSSRYVPYILLYCIVLYYIVLYYIVLYCIVLYCSR
jgi:hypothetical protein